MPVKTHGTMFELVDSYYAFMQHRELVEKASPAAIRNDAKAIGTLGDFLKLPRTVWPTPPEIPRKEAKILPPPETIHALLHAKYAPDPARSYSQHLVKTLLALDFGIGLRFPSEAYALRLGDFDPENHLLVITEPKKGGPRRRLYIEPTWLCCSPSKPSLANYLRYWRPRVADGTSDAFFLGPDGKPFHDKIALKVWLDRKVKKTFPWFHGYLGRTWAANARLIEWGWDYVRVANWLGHSSVESLRKAYDQDARHHARLYGDGWIDRAFRKIRKDSPRLKGIPNLAAKLESP